MNKIYETLYIKHKIYFWTLCVVYAQNMWHSSPWESSSRSMEFFWMHLVCSSDIQYSWLWGFQTRWLAGTNICYNNDCLCTYSAACWGKLWLSTLIFCCCCNTPLLTTTILTADSQYSHFFNSYYSTTVTTTKVHCICQRNLSATEAENKGQSVDIVQPTFNNWSNFRIIIVIIIIILI